jgi:Na+/H+ antiporter NhaD/arsenite permease-like protein
MHEEENSSEISTTTLIKRLLLLVGISLTVSLIGYKTILDMKQTISSSIFFAIILGTLFFWSFRLSIAFIGLAVLIFTNSINIPQFVESAALPVILFLVGMMIIVGALKDLGFFTWIVQIIVSMPKLSARRFIATTAVASALLACAVDEVTSIIFISTLIFQVCDRLKLNPSPYIIICVLCTNVGSAGTMMGNPVGIFIGTRAGLTFEDFIIWAFPIMLLSLLLCVAITIVYYRKELSNFDEKLKERLSKDLGLVPKIKVLYKQGLIVLVLTILFIASHHQLEKLLNLEKNSILLIAPLICSGFIMLFKRDKARYYVEREVDWWTLLFFMLLFAIAGTLEHTHVTNLLAEKFSNMCGANQITLIPLIMFVSAIGSAFIDNVIFVAAFCPVIEELSKSVNAFPLWWALLFGACFGGNITMIGSTANIVALGMLEKKSKIHVKFFDWLKIGALSAFATLLIACILLFALKGYMPNKSVNHMKMNQISQR